MQASHSAGEEGGQQKLGEGTPFPWSDGHTDRWRCCRLTWYFQHGGPGGARCHHGKQSQGEQLRLPDLRWAVSLPWLSHDAYSYPLQAKRIVSEKPMSQARSPRAKGTSGGGRGQSSPLQTTFSPDSAGKVHLKNGLGTQSPSGEGRETMSDMFLAQANLA